MRLIDADYFIAKTRELYNQAGWGFRDVHYSQSDVEMNLSMMPTVDPVRHGEWIKVYENNYQCSECGDWLTAHGEDIKTLHYCTNCGAKMNEEEE